jgi:NAD-dependent dihydropyrimidine dehydrogenase PreA subunit
LLTLREGNRLRVFEITVVRRIFRLKRDEVTGEWRRLHNDGLCELYCPPNVIYMIKSRRMRPIGRPRCRRTDKIKMGPKEMRWGDIDWIDMAQDTVRRKTLVNMVMNLWCP